MARRIRDAVTALIVTALAVVSGVAPALAQKQTVVAYTAIENEQITEYMKAITKALPNIDLKLLRLSTGDISARFMAEKDNMQADVIWGVGATNILTRRSREPLLRPARAAAEASFRASGDGTRTVETFEILHFAAWTPASEAPLRHG